MLKRWSGIERVMYFMREGRTYRFQVFDEHPFFRRHVRPEGVLFGDNENKPPKATELSTLP
jgi:hypothetical protein